MRCPREIANLPDDHVLALLSAHTVLAALPSIIEVPQSFPTGMIGEQLNVDLAQRTIERILVLHRDHAAASPRT